MTSKKEEDTDGHGREDGEDDGDDATAWYAGCHVNNEISRLKRNNDGLSITTNAPSTST
jgi:hypothetical protein